MLIEFDDTLVTGNSTIDEQHKELIKRIGNLITACEEGDGKVNAMIILMSILIFISLQRKNFRRKQDILIMTIITRNMRSSRKQSRS